MSSPPSRHPAPEGVEWLTFSPSGNHLAAACTGCTLQLWDLGRIRAQLAWEATDGSKVVGDAAELLKQAPAPDPKTAIPWLLVKVKAADGKPGAFAEVLYIQRLSTAGGRAPADPPKRLATRVGVPYTATYQLWARK